MQHALILQSFGAINAVDAKPLNDLLKAGAKFVSATPLGVSVAVKGTGNGERGFAAVLVIVEK